MDSEEYMGHARELLGQYEGPYNIVHAVARIHPGTPLDPSELRQNGST